jgi:glycosyltransferase involved in cell wall biosynthesis
LSLSVLCLDIEGGYGGSSRSLYESLRHLPPDVTTEVWCRKQGPIQERYAAIGIPCRVAEDMPHINSLPRLSRNVYIYAKFLLRWHASASFRDTLLKAAARFDIIHFNHEGLFLLARWLRRRLGRHRPGLTMHIRTHSPSSLFSRWQFRTIGRSVDQLAFITENERSRVEMLAGRPLPGRTIYNVASAPSIAPEAPDELAADTRFKVAAIGTYAYIRGFDRLADVAIALKRRGREDVVFVIAGDMTLRSSPGDLGELAKRGGNLHDYVEARGVASMFRFLGHVADPERVLTHCDLVVRPSRGGDPWGRDVLEAMACGRAVMATGRYDRFVENGVTGVLHDAFDSALWADEIDALSRDRVLATRLGRAARERVLQLCDGQERALDLTRLWQSARRTGKQVLFTLPDFEGGGAQRVLVTVANALDRARFTPSILVLDERGPWRNMVASDISVTSLGKPRLRRSLWALRAAMRRAAPDVIVSTIGYFNLGVLLTRPRRSRLIVRESNMPGHGSKEVLSRLMQRLAYAILYRRADCVVSPSGPVAHELTENYRVSPQLVQVIPNPVDVVALREAALPPQRRPGVAKRFVAVGRLSRQKGYDRLVDLLASATGNIHVAVFGDGEERHLLENQVRAMDVSERIAFAGFNPSPAAWIAGADALLLPSRWEGLPNVVLEALACGTPVIATPEAGGINDIARLARPGAVSIVPMGPQFLAAMLAAPKNDAVHLRESLLPTEFQLDSVVAEYERLLDLTP